MLTIADQAARAMFVSPSTRKPLVLRDGALTTEDLSEAYPVVGDRAFFITTGGLDAGSSMARS
jgi:hypothetical protein